MAISLQCWNIYFLEALRKIAIFKSYHSMGDGETQSKFGKTDLVYIYTVANCCSLCSKTCYFFCLLSLFLHCGWTKNSDFKVLTDALCVSITTASLCFEKATESELKTKMTKKHFIALHCLIGAMEDLYKKMTASPNIPRPTTRHVFMGVCKLNDQKMLHWI